MWNAAIKSLLGRKVRLLLSTFAIVLGVAFVAGSLVFVDTLNRSFTALFASTVGDVVVRPLGAADATGQASTKTIDVSLVKKLERSVPGANRVDGQIQVAGVVVLGRDGKVVGGLGPPSLGANWSTAPAGHGLGGMIITDGHEPRGKDQIVLDADTALKGGYTVGSKVPLISLTRKEPIMTKLVGIAEVADGGSLNGGNLIYFTTPRAQELLLKGEKAFNSIWVTANPDVSQTQLRAQVAKQLPKGLQAITGDDLAEENASFLMDALKFLTIFLLIFAAISVIVGAFLIVNTFSMLVAQRSRELALLRALGASGPQVTGSVLIEALVIGLLGATAGIGLGVVLAMGIVRLFGSAGLDISGQPLVFAPRTFVAAYLVGVGVTMFAAWLPARRTSKIAPIQALRDDVAMPDSSLRGRLLGAVGLTGLALVAGYLGLFSQIDHAGYYTGFAAVALLLAMLAASPALSTPFLVVAQRAFAALFGTVGKLAGQNALRNPRRTSVTASALMIGLAVAGTMTILADSAKTSVDETMRTSFVGDYVVRGVVMGAPFNPGIADRMSKVKGVTKVTRERWSTGEYEGKVVGISAARAQDLKSGLGLQVVDGDLGKLKPGTFMVSQTRADKLGLKVGDTVELKLNGVAHQAPIVGIYADTPMVPLQWLTVPQTLLKAGYPDRDNMLVIRVKQRSKAIEDELKATVKDLPVVNVNNQAAYAAERRAPIDQMVSMIFALLGLALLIAVLGIVNTLALSVIERTREVGLLRAVGLTRGQIRAMVTFESVVISLLGAVLGLALGLVFGIAGVHALRNEGLTTLSIPWDQLGWFLALSVVVGVLAAVMPARRAANLNVLGAISHD